MRTDMSKHTGRIGHHRGLDRGWQGEEIFSWFCITMSLSRHSLYSIDCSSIISNPLPATSLPSAQPSHLPTPLGLMARHHMALLQAYPPTCTQICTLFPATKLSTCSFVLSRGVPGCWELCYGKWMSQAQWQLRGSSRQKERGAAPLGPQGW